jgi:hypothetical protein
VGEKEPLYAVGRNVKINPATTEIGMEFHQEAKNRSSI